MNRLRCATARSGTAAHVRTTPRVRKATDGQMSGAANDRVVLISWKDCDCQWWTKYCEEEHVKHAVVDRAQLRELTGKDHQ